MPSSHVFLQQPSAQQTEQAREKKVQERELDLIQKNLAEFSKSIRTADDSKLEVYTKAAQRMSFWSCVPEKIGQRVSSVRTRFAVSYMYTIPAFSAATAEFVFKGKRYGLMKSSITNISQKPYASCGSSSAREILLIDPENATLLNWHFKKLKQSLLKEHEDSLGGLSTEEFLTIVKKYVQKNIFPSWNNRAIEAMIEEIINAEKSNSENIIYNNQGEPVVVLSIEDFIRRGIGACRHHALVTGYLLDRLCRDITIPFAPLGIVQNIRDNITRGAHVWVTFLEKDRKFHLDTLWNILQEFTTDEQQNQLIRRGYGEHAIRYQATKAKESDTVFKEDAVNRALRV